MGKNIAFIIPEMGNGGAERVISNLTLELPDDIKRTIIQYYRSEFEYDYIGDMVNLNLPGTPSAIGKLINLIRRVIRIKRIKKERGISTTISFLENPNFTNILSRKNDRIIISVRNYKSREIETEGFSGTIFKLVIMALYNRADLIIAVSNAIKEDLEKNFKIRPEKIRVINNPYDIELIQKLAAEPLEQEYEEIFKHPVIITAGRLSIQKGHWHLIRALGEVKKGLPSAKLLILGQGDLYDYLKGLSKELGMEQDINFLGQQKNPFKFISRSRIFVLSSLFEGFPNSLAEAMACGVPVISSDCLSGPREILWKEGKGRISGNGTKAIEYADSGVLIPVCDGKLYGAGEPLSLEEKIMAQGIVEMMSDEELLARYKKLSKERIEDFRSEKILKEYMEVI